jgi:hypothetical protein
MLRECEYGSRMWYGSEGSVGVECGTKWSLSVGVGSGTGVRVSDVVRNEV